MDEFDPQKNLQAQIKYGRNKAEKNRISNNSIQLHIIVPN